MVLRESRCYRNSYTRKWGRNGLVFWVGRGGAIETVAPVKRAGVDADGYWFCREEGAIGVAPSIDGVRVGADWY